jgi:hypothetical protein
VVSSAIAAPSAKIKITLTPLATSPQLSAVPVRPQAEGQGRYEHAHDGRQQSHLEFNLSAAQPLDAD